MLFDGFHSGGILVDNGGMVNLLWITACAIMETKHGNYVLLLVRQGFDDKHMFRANLFGW